MKKLLNKFFALLICLALLVCNNTVQTLAEEIDIVSEDTILNNNEFEQTNNEGSEQSDTLTVQSEEEQPSQNEEMIQTDNEEAPDAQLESAEYILDPIGDATYSLTYENIYWGSTDFAWIITGFTGTASGTLVIPSTIDGYPVVEIGDSAFQKCNGFTGISLPDSLKLIGEYAFQCCDGLTGSLIIPSSVMSIDKFAFAACDGLTGGLTFSGNFIGDSAFSGCSGLTEIISLGNISTISSHLFYDCSGLTKITIPSSVKSINYNAFSGCSKLTEITIPSSVTSVDNGAFSYCANLARIDNKSSKYIRSPYDYYGSHRNYYWINEATGDVLKQYDDKGTYTIPSGVTALRRDGKAPDEDTPDGDAFERWGFSNSSDNFGKEENGYCITESDHNRLLTNLPQTLKDDVAYEYNVGGSKPTGSKWSGSCYGMSTSVMRIHNGDDAIADYGLGSAEKLNDIDAADSSYKTKGKDSVGAAESVINFYHYQQLLPEYQQIRAEYSSYSDATQVSRLADIAKSVQSDKKVALADIWWYENNRLQGHSINITGYRELSSSESRYSTYPHCILTFDCSNPDSAGNSSDFNIYFNDSGEWTVPGWNITPANSHMLCGSIESQTTGPVDYKNGNYASASQMPANIDYHGSNGEWELVFDENDDQFVRFDGDRIVDDADDGLDAFVLPKMTDGNDDTYRIYVPKEKDYRIKGDVIDHTVHTKDRTVHVEAEEGGQASVYDDGSAEVVLNDKGKIVIDIIDDTEDSSSSHIIIRDDDTRTLDVEIKDEGLLIKGEDLYGLEVEFGDKKIIVDSEDDSVLVKKNDDGTIEAFEDVDGDGIYSDPVEIESTGFRHSEVQDQIYTGSQIKPSVSIFHENTLLKEKTDYTIKYSNNVNAGSSALITITGKGNFSGTEKITFSIRPKNISDEDITISDIPASLYNARKDYMPVPTVNYGKKKLANMKDFSVAYYTSESCTQGSLISNPRNAGTYYAKIKGINNFTGEVVKKFTIGEVTKKLVSKLTVSKIPDQPYAGGAEICPALIVKDGKKQLVEKTGSSQSGDYTIKYRNNTEVGTATVVITGTGDEYVGSKSATFKITGVPLSKTKVIGFVQSFEYDGTEKKQDITLTYTPKGGETKDVRVAEKTEYDKLNTSDKRIYGAVVTYTNNIKAGTATMLLTGVNGYTGTIKKTYKINPFNVKEDAGVHFKAELNPTVYPYSKAGVKPEPIVKYNGVILKKGTDYTISYSNNTILSGNPKKVPKVKITGKGNFKGVASELEFDIVPKSLDSEDIEVTVGDKVYANKAGNWKPSVSVTDDGKKLSAGKDYDKNISYTYVSIPAGMEVCDGSQKTKPEIERVVGDIVGDKDIVPAGTIIGVCLNATGNYYKDSNDTTTFRIVAKDISKLNASVQAKTYTGKPVTLEKDDIRFNVSIGETVTYEIVPNSYKNNILKGKASVTVRGTENYGGTKNLTYTIGAKGLLWWVEDLIHEQTYTVTFNSQGGTSVAPIKEIKKGATIVLPLAPTKTGWTFAGWYTEPNGKGTQFTNNTRVKKDITVYACWKKYYKITFDSQGGTSVSAIENAEVGMTVTLPTSPTKTDWTFIGWYTEPNGQGTQFTNSTIVNGNITVYAYWKKYYTVTFDSQGGTSVPAIENVEEGSTIVLPMEPTKSGWIFAGWYTEPDGEGSRYVGKWTAIGQDRIFYAYWVKNSSDKFIYDELEDGTIRIRSVVEDGSTDLVIPSQIKGKDVTVIGRGACKMCDSFTGTLTIPDTVVEIEDEAFYRCIGFTGNLVIPNSVTRIGMGAFGVCSNFKGLTLGEGVEEIDSYAFINCLGLKGNLTITDCVISIGTGAFSGCSGFDGTLSIGENIEEMDYNAFSGCTGLKKVVNLSSEEIGLPIVEGKEWKNEDTKEVVTSVSEGSAVLY